MKDRQKLWLFVASATFCLLSLWRSITSSASDRFATISRTDAVVEHKIVHTSTRIRSVDTSQPTPKGAKIKVFSLSQVPEVRPFIYASNEGQNVLCDWAANSTSKEAVLVANVTFGCEHAFKRANAGTGNFLIALYKLRANAQVLGVNVSITCEDALEKRDRLILPWILGHFQAPTTVESSETCSTVSVSHLLQDIRFELRRMAVAMVGIPSSEHPSAAFAKDKLWSRQRQPCTETCLQVPDPQRNDAPILPNLKNFDDVAIHFRCGDLIRRDHPGFGFIRFSAYAKHISPHAQSIGIITQPFRFARSGQARKADTQNGKGERCRIIVNALQEYLQTQFPNATVKIHNDLRTETMVSSYTRLIMANQTFSAISSFGVFAALASFGTGFVIAKLSNEWLLHPPITQLTNSVVIMDEPYILSGDLKALWNGTENASQVLAWFTSDDN